MYVQDILENFKPWVKHVKTTFNYNKHSTPGTHTLAAHAFINVSTVVFASISYSSCIPLDYDAFIDSRLNNKKYLYAAFSKVWSGHYRH